MSVNRSNADEMDHEYPKLEVLRRTAGYMRPYLARITLVVLLMLLSSVILTALPFLLGNAVDRQIAGGDGAGLVRLAAVYIALVLLWWLMYVARVRLMASVSNAIVLRIRDEAYAHVLSLDLQFFDSRPNGKILSRLVGDAGSLNNMLKQLVTNIVPNIFFLILLIAAMFVMNPVLALSVFACLPVAMLGAFCVLSVSYPRWRAYRQKQGNIAGYCQEVFSGAKIVQSCNAQGECTGQFDRINEETGQVWKKAVRVGDLIGIVIDLSQGLGYLALFALSIHLLRMDGSSVGQLIAFTSFISLFWQPVRALANMYNQLGNDLAGAGRVFELLDRKAAVDDSRVTGPMETVRGDVDFRSVSFAYPDEPERLVLRDLTFHVDAGSRVALVGPTGAGKTTIASLVARFYDPVSGCVLVDGRPLDTIAQADLRRSIAVMTQDNWIFSGTIGENIAYARRDASRQEIEEVARAIGIHDFIASLEDGYDTDVDKARLSSGQRQLVALARTLLADPRILILDEATSSIDTKSEIRVQQGIALLSRERTSFIVAHRLSTIRSCDVICVVQDGGIAESGSHDELMARRGAYWRLHEAAQAGICG